MTDAQLLRRVLSDPGDWTFVSTDGHGDEPTPAEEERRRSVRDRLDDAGVDAADVDAVDAALKAGAGIPSPSTRYLLARNGEIVVDESFVSARIGPERLGRAALPPVLPLLRHAAADTVYLVVEAGREGARVRTERAERAGDTGETDIEGRTDSLPKVQAGGWSQRRYQMHTEGIWKQNQTEVADVVDRLVREERPRFVIVAGDIRARGLLIDALSAASRELVVEVDSHTKAEGADDAARDDAVEQALEDAVKSEVEHAQSRAAIDDGARRAEGIDAVVDALQQAQVDTLLLDARFLDAEQTLTALDAAPWVVSSPSAESAGAESVAEIPVAEALARAALLTDARVLVLESERDAGEPRTDRPTAPPMALLRWSEPAT